MVYGGSVEYYREGIIGDDMAILGNPHLETPIYGPGLRPGTHHPDGMVPPGSPAPCNVASSVCASVQEQEKILSETPSGVCALKTVGLETQHELSMHVQDKIS